MCIAAIAAMPAVCSAAFRIDPATWMHWNPYFQTAIARAVLQVCTGRSDGGLWVNGERWSK